MGIGIFGIACIKFIVHECGEGKEEALDRCLTQEEYVEAIACRSGAAHFDLSQQLRDQLLPDFCIT